VRYLVRTVLGFGLMVMCWVIFGYGIYQLLQIGTCASGGPYEVARPCPDGTGRLGMMIPAALLLMFIAAGLYATRGKPPGSDRPARSALVITFFWTGIFWSMGAGALLGVWGPEANAGPDGKLGGLIVGFLFIPMGAIGLFGLKEAGGKRKGKRQGERSTGEISVPPAPSFPGYGKASKALRSRLPSEDPVDRLERLSRLRDRGSLTDEEFEVLKGRIVKEGR
jgi:hypothetical protein